MQRQKTIAKWLSVVLLTTIAIASYILLSTIGKNAPSDSAVAGAGNTSQTDVPTPPIIYSTLPRACETVKGFSVAHAGGSKQEEVVDYVDFCGKTLVFFSSNSVDRDVKEAGLYIAVFDGQATLERTVKIAGNGAEYLTSSLCKNGLTVFIKNQDKTDVFLLNEEMIISAKTAIDRYDDIINVSNAHGLYLCVNDECMRMVKLDGALNQTTDNFVYQNGNIKVAEAFYINGKTLIFTQVANQVKFLQYSQDRGFICQFSQDKSTLLQILPVVASNEQTFLALIKSQNSLTVNSFDADLRLVQSHDLPYSQKAIMLATDIGIEVLIDGNIIRYCPHLDFLAESEIDNPELVQNATEYHTVSGVENFFIAKREKGFDLFKKTGDNLTVVFGCSQDVLPQIQAIKTVNNSMRFSLFFDCDNKEEFSYMCFGDKDVYYLSLTTSLS